MTDDVSQEPLITYSGEVTPCQTKENPLIQYVILRRDLGWGIGPMITQAVHATTAVLKKTENKANTVKFTSNILNMTTITLGVETEQELLGISEQLLQSDIDHFVWIEQPENIPTAIAIEPIDRKEKLEGRTSRMIRSLKKY